MIHIGIIDISEINHLSDGDVLNKILSILPDRIIYKIENTRNKKEKKLRTGAYLLLFYMYKSIFGENSVFPDIIFDEGEKPRFDFNSATLPYPCFNISHSEDFAAVAISDGDRNVGIDVQAEPRLKSTLERVAVRFFGSFKKSYTGVCLNEKNTEISTETEFFKEDENDNEPPGKFNEKQIYFYSLDKELSIKENEEGTETLSFAVLDEESAKKDTLARWTVLEASLKMSGGGFADYPDAERILPKTDMVCAIFKKGKTRYALTCAFEKTDCQRMKI